MAEISIIVVLLAGIGFGIYLFVKPTSKPAEPVAEQEEEAEVMMAEEYCVIDEAQDGTDPRDGVELSADEALMIETEEDAIDELSKGEEHLAALRELGYRIGAQENAPKEERREDVVADTEEDGRNYYPADGPGRSDPFEYQQHNI